MKSFKSHFKFNKQERSGIFFLLLLIVLLQVGYFAYVSLPQGKNTLLTVDSEIQARIDTLKENAALKDSVKIYPFNPNFITDYKGYTLGMTAIEIDRLHAFRKLDKFANSPEEFQKVTRISDSLLAVISPYFKFPEWTKKRRQSSVSSTQYNTGRSSSPFSNGPGEKTVKDLNKATAEDLKSVNGIGEVLSARIIKFRNRLGGFLVDEQLRDVYGLEPEVVEKTLRLYKVLSVPSIEKINVNSASAEELQKLIYLQRKVAQDIVNYRNDNGTIDSFDELLNIEDFPSDKIERIALYLSLKK